MNVYPMSPFPDSFVFRHLGIDKVVLTNSCVNYDVMIPATGEPEDTSYLPCMFSLKI